MKDQFSSTVRSFVAVMVMAIAFSYGLPFHTSRYQISMSQRRNASRKQFKPHIKSITKNDVNSSKRSPPMPLFSIASAIVAPAKNHEATNSCDNYNNQNDEGIYEQLVDNGVQGKTQFSNDKQQKKQKIIPSISQLSSFSSASMNVKNVDESVTDNQKSYSFSSGYLHDKNRRQSVEAKSPTVEVTTQLPTSLETLLMPAFSDESISRVPVSLLPHESILTAIVNDVSASPPVVIIDDIPNVKNDFSISVTTTAFEDVTADAEVDVSVVTSIPSYGFSSGYLRNKKLRHLVDDASSLLILSQSTASSVQCQHTETSDTTPLSPENVDPVILLSKDENDITSLVPKVSTTTTYGLHSGYIRDKSSHQLSTPPSTAFPTNAISNMQSISSVSSPSFIVENKNISVMGMINDDNRNVNSVTIIPTTAETSNNIDSISSNNNLDLKSMIQQHRIYHSTLLTHSITLNTTISKSISRKEEAENMIVQELNVLRPMLSKELTIYENRIVQLKNALKSFNSVVKVKINQIQREGKILHQMKKIQQQITENSILNPINQAIIIQQQLMEINQNIVNNALSSCIPTIQQELTSINIIYESLKKLNKRFMLLNTNESENGQDDHSGVGKMSNYDCTWSDIIDMQSVLMNSTEDRDKTWKTADDSMKRLIESLNTAEVKRASILLDNQSIIQQRHEKYTAAALSSVTTREATTAIMNSTSSLPSEATSFLNHDEQKVIISVSAASSTPILASSHNNINNTINGNIRLSQQVGEKSMIISSSSPNKHNHQQQQQQHKAINRRNLSLNLNVIEWFHTLISPFTLAYPSSSTATTTAVAVAMQSMDDTVVSHNTSASSFLSSNGAKSFCSVWNSDIIAPSTTRGDIKNNMNDYALNSKSVKTLITKSSTSGTNNYIVTSTSKPMLKKSTATSNNNNNNNNNSIKHNHKTHMVVDSNNIIPTLLDRIKNIFMNTSSKTNSGNKSSMSSAAAVADRKISIANGRNNKYSGGVITTVTTSGNKIVRPKTSVKV